MKKRRVIELCPTCRAAEDAERKRRTAIRNAKYRAKNLEALKAYNRAYSKAHRKDISARNKTLRARQRPAQAPIVRTIQESINDAFRVIPKGT